MNNKDNPTTGAIDGQTRPAFTAHQMAFIRTVARIRREIVARRAAETPAATAERLAALANESETADDADDTVKIFASREDLKRYYRRRQ